MNFTTETTENGVCERLFTVHGVPGVIWSPAGVTGRRPLVLLGHGGGQHKKAPGVLTHAHRFVTACGFVAAAIDLPGHGDRPKVEQHQQLMSGIREQAEAGAPIGPQIARYNAVLSQQAVPEWQSVLDTLLTFDDVDPAGPVGFWGLSMSGAIGVRFVAAEPRIRAAVLGLVSHETLVEAAAQVTVPVEFLLQWDDEVVPRASGLALFDALSSSQKSLHANPGGHRDVPSLEMSSSERFFERHLTPGGAATDRQSYSGR